MFAVAEELIRSRVNSPVRAFRNVGGDETGGKRDGGLSCEQQQAAFAELDYELGPELARELACDEADINGGEA